MPHSLTHLLAYSLTLLALCAPAADITKGYTFTPNEKNITHTKLNNLVDLATINSTFITDKAAGTPAPADSFVFYSAAGAGLRRGSLSTLFLANTNLIVAQGEVDNPAANDFVLLYQTSSGLLVKTPLSGLYLTNSLLIDGRAELTNAPPDNLQFLVSSNGLYTRIGLSNVFAQWWRYEKFASNTVPLFSAHTAPTNTDLLRIWNSANQTNKSLSLAGLMTNPPAVTALTNTDSLLLFSTVTNAANPYGTNPVFSRVTLAGLQTNPPVTTAVTNGDTLVFWSTATNGPAGTNGAPTLARLPMTNLLTLLNVQRFTSAESNLVVGTVCDIAHGLAGTPQQVNWVLTCKTNDAGYAVGDEVQAIDACDSSSAVLKITSGANATNVFLSSSSASGLALRHKSTGVLTPMNELRWRAKCYATYYP